MQVVIPMAGAGKRFLDAGYSLPKPLIPVSGIPMVVRAVRDLPAADRLIFVCRQDHLEEYRVEEVLKDYFPGCFIVAAPGLTEGQACTVRLAGDLLIPGEPVLVAACDNTHLYDPDKLNQVAQDPTIDAIIWTYRGEPRVQVAPQMYGWVRTGEGIEVTEVSVKKPISSRPLEDHVVSGAFYFRTARGMLEAIDSLVASAERVNGEFYLDSLPGLLLHQGRRVVVFEVEKYIGWGTPPDLEDYCRWERYFTGASAWSATLLAPPPGTGNFLPTGFPICVHPPNPRRSS